MTLQVSLRNDNLQLILAPLFHHFPEIQRLILFGSRARGDHDERSDIDIAIDAEMITRARWDDIYFFKEENLDTLLSIDLVWIQRASERLKQQISKEGVTLFEREINAKYE